jgi:hypothetical protein
MNWAVYKGQSISCRLNTWFKRVASIYLHEYPIEKQILILDSAALHELETISNTSHVPDKEENDGEEGWICGKGVAVKTNKNPTVQCFCPPIYILPFLINLLSTIILIIRKRATATTKITDHSNTVTNMRSTFRTYIDVMTEYKELILAPLFIMALSSDHFLLRHLSLISPLI